ncbi:MAG: DsbA family protein, partial [Candidatus Nanohaloarchaea archaeon]|nr:DsbA family protein [Candidatus Nanohaloarchaea archaeon]
QEVNEDKQEGSSLGVSGTPTVFINGKKIVGAQPYSRFKSVIESELSG